MFPRSPPDKDCIADCSTCVCRPFKVQTGDFPRLVYVHLRVYAISVCKMAAKRRKLNMSAVEEVQLDSATFDGDCDSDEEVYEGYMNALVLPHGRGTMN